MSRATIGDGTNESNGAIISEGAVIVDSTNADMLKPPHLQTLLNMLCKQEQSQEL